jgi:hypothetical protein
MFLMLGCLSIVLYTLSFWGLGHVSEKLAK